MKTLLGCLMVSKTVRSWSEFCRAGWRCVGQGWQSSKECGHGIRPSVVKMCAISGTLWHLCLFFIGQLPRRLYPEHPKSAWQTRLRMFVAKESRKWHTF